MSLQITWHGHSCFTLSADGYSVVLDPYEPGSVPGLAPLHLLADEVLCSHGHADHACERVVTLKEKHAENPFSLQQLHTWHDRVHGALRGENTIHILKYGELKAAHLGDLGCSLLPQEKEQLAGLDVLMIPIGGFFTIDAGEAFALVKELAPRVVLPMHYRGDTFGYGQIGRLEAYTRLAGPFVRYDTNTIRITKATPAQTAVLSCPGEE